MIYKFSILIFALLLSTAQALTMGSEVVLFTPWTLIRKQVSNAISSHDLGDQKKIAAADWRLGEWTPHLTNVQWTLKGKMNLVGMTPNNLEINSKQLSFNIVINRLNLDQVIEREMNGAVLRIHVQAQCGPITMSQSSAATDLRLGFVFQPTHVSTQIDSFDLQWKPGSWQISSFPCTGPAGFDQTLKNELIQNLRSPEQIKPWLETLIAERAQLEADHLVNELANPIPVHSDKVPLPMVLKFFRIQNSNEGILNFGTLVWSGRPDETNLSKMPLTPLPGEVIKSAAPVFVAPTDGWTNLIQAQMAAHGKPKINLQQMKSFNDLMNSPSQQAVVWPDLENYAANSPFTLLLDNPPATALHWQNDGTAKYSTAVNGVIRSQRAGKTWDYVALTGHVAGAAAANVSLGTFSLNVSVASSNFAGQFVPAYVRTFNSDTTLDARVMQALSTEVNKGYRMTSTLPSLNLGMAGVAVFNGWKGVGPQLMAMPLSVSAKPSSDK